MRNNQLFKNGKFKNKLVEFNYSSVLSDDSLFNHQNYQVVKKIVM